MTRASVNAGRKRFDLEVHGAIVKILLHTFTSVHRYVCSVEFAHSACVQTGEKRIPGEIKLFESLYRLAIILTILQACQDQSALS